MNTAYKISSWSRTTFLKKTTLTSTKKRNHRTSTESNWKSLYKQSNRNDNEPSSKKGCQKRTPNVCVFCNQDYHSSFCDQYNHQSIEAKRVISVWKALASFAWANIWYKTAPSGQRCSICNQKHHSCLPAAEESSSIITPLITEI